MNKAKVYFTDFRTKIGVSQCTKLQRLCRAAGIAGIFKAKINIWRAAGAE